MLFVFRYQIPHLFLNSPPTHNVKLLPLLLILEMIQWGLLFKYLLSLYTYFIKGGEDGRVIGE